MPASEYKNTISGGLKLKGAKDAGVKKKKKSKDKSHSKDKDSTPTLEEAAELEGEERRGESALQKALAHEDEGSNGLSEEDLRRLEPRRDGKTEAQRRHEEMRRKRLDERLKKEGVKTHKERVEELNKYLSTLSEHHDMPRIGPG